ncbi:MAG: hypothetical protein ACKV22_01240 [Bryobacteraceae bacterium]
MTSATYRLRSGADVLATIDRRRDETGNAGIGVSIERSILEREFAELEEDILADPGALESLLVPVKKRLRGQAIHEQRHF